MINRYIEIETDMVVLSTAVEANDVDELLRVLRVEKGTDGFIKEFHLKIRPTDTTVKNVFVCGAAQGPKDVTDCIAQAGSAAMSAAVFLGRGELELSPLVAQVKERLCRACGRCEEACTFDAIRVGERAVAEVDETLCEGCGRCAVVCPTGAAEVRSFRERQVAAEVDALLERVR
jgi:heterodisulfide reductase subunit A